MAISLFRQLKHFPNERRRVEFIIFYVFFKPCLTQILSASVRSQSAKFNSNSCIQAIFSANDLEHLPQMISIHGLVNSIRFDFAISDYATPICLTSRRIVAKCNISLFLPHQYLKFKITYCQIAVFRSSSIRQFRSRENRATNRCNPLVRPSTSWLNHSSWYPGPLRRRRAGEKTVTPLVEILVSQAILNITGLVPRWIERRSYGTRALDWTDSHYGPEHAGYWESVVYIRGVEYGRGKGATQSEALAVNQHYAPYFSDRFLPRYRGL
ncbi:hypothetical protein ABKN59_005085 [Abortiporus biennis]